MKELEEATEKIVDILDDERPSFFKEYYICADHILNLKGDGWGLAIVRDNPAIVFHEGVVTIVPEFEKGLLPKIDGTFKKVIWQGE